MSESRRRDVFFGCAIVAVALVVRLLHLHEVALHDPYYALPTVDDLQYDAWAKRLAAGEGLPDGVLYLGPGYPFFMAAVYAVFGPSLPAVKAVQVGLGAATCGLVFALARSLFDRRVAIVAGLLAALHAMLIFYGGTLMTTNLKVPLVLATTLALVRGFRAPSAAGFAFAGLLLGLAALVQQTILPLAPLVVLWLLFGQQGELPFARRLALGAIFVVGIAVCILPFTLHNIRTGHDFVLLNSMGGPNFYMGNQREADGTWQVPSLGSRRRADNPDEMQRQFKAAAERATRRAMKPSEISAYWTTRGLDEIRADPGRWLRLELRKLGLHFNAYEVWNIRAFELSQPGSWILRLPLATMGFVAPLGLLGLALTLPRWRELVVLYGVIAVYLAASLLFFVLARYRLPGVLMFVPFAAFALVWIADAARARELRRLARAGAGLAVFTALVHLPLESSQGRMHMAWYNLGNKYRELERWDEAIAAYQRSLELLPGAVSTHNNLAVAYELGGRREEAIREWRIVAELGRRQRDPARIERAERHLEALSATPDASASSATSAESAPPVPAAPSSPPAPTPAPSP
jgi:4-amino-4-deoxy-L-arabinose transferase-like glycosyltransferase